VGARGSTLAMNADKKGMSLMSVMAENSSGRKPTESTQNALSPAPQPP
jgi:hypothetical protein